jgi:hypothetical protein
MTSSIVSTDITPGVVEAADLFGVTPESARERISLTTKHEFLMQLMADRKVPRTSKCVATVLLLKFIDVKTGECNPSGIEISRATSFASNTVYTALNDLKAAGWITIEGPERRGWASKRGNKYSFNFDRVNPTARVPS